MAPQQDRFRPLGEGAEPHSKAKREFYGYLQMSFSDVDVDKDGKINAQDFNDLCEKVAAMPMQTHAHGVPTMERKVRPGSVLSFSQQVHPTFAICNMAPPLSPP